MLQKLARRSRQQAHPTITLALLLLTADDRQQSRHIQTSYTYQPHLHTSTTKLLVTREWFTDKSAQQPRRSSTWL